MPGDSSTDLVQAVPSIRERAHHPDVSRRAFLRLLAMGGVADLLAACTQSAPPLPTPVATAPTIPATLVPTAPPPPPSPTLIPTIAPTPTPRSLGAPKPASYAKLPRWRGFNLLEKFNYAEPAHNKAYNQQDLDFMVEWGFDFIRLPLDYRIWTTSSEIANQQALQELDQVIAWARIRGIHVNLCLHRAPGYCVNRPKEALDLWANDPAGHLARIQFAAQWSRLATRYKDISPRELSFNLLNEPPDITGETYATVVEPAITAIRTVSPDRIMLADGAKYAFQPVAELVKLQLAQSTRGYDPMLVTHYNVPWIPATAQWPTPSWPIRVMINQYLYGTDKPNYTSPLVISGDFPNDAKLTIRVQKVSRAAKLKISANGKQILLKTFLPETDQSIVKEFLPEWNIYQAVYNQELTVTLPQKTQTIQIEVAKGDWLTFSEITITPFPQADAQTLVIKAIDDTWGVPQESIVIDPQGVLSSANGKNRFDKERLWNNHVEPWKAFSTKQGVGIFVGEWGAYNQAPHDVVLAWMQDCLENWQQAGIGWALWNLRGEFGVLDSRRSDIDYEDYYGHKLDRAMLEVLKNG